MCCPSPIAGGGRPFLYKDAVVRWPSGQWMLITQSFLVTQSRGDWATGRPVLPIWAPKPGLPAQPEICVGKGRFGFRRVLGITAGFPPGAGLRTGTRGTGRGDRPKLVGSPEVSPVCALSAPASMFALGCTTGAHVVLPVFLGTCYTLSRYVYVICIELPQLR